MINLVMADKNVQSNQLLVEFISESMLVATNLLTNE